MVSDPESTPPKPPDHAAEDLPAVIPQEGEVVVSTSSAAFFLDATYRSLSDDETPLREALQRLAVMTASDVKDSVGHIVRRLLENLGADGE